LSSANLLGNFIGVEQAQVLLKIKKAKKAKRTLCGLSGDETELDLSGKGLGPGCAILLALELEANGQLSSLNILKNDIKEEQAQALIRIKHEKKMITLCGLKGDETELNLSGKMTGAADALMLAEEIKDMGSLSKLKMSKYELPVQEIKTATELDLSGKGLDYLDAIVIAALIKVQTTAQNHLVTN
jgi:hypothetical protein